MQALHVAAYNGWSDEVARLLTEGAGADVRDDKGFTPLHWACFRAAVTDQRSVIRLLLEKGADPNALTSNGLDTPLIWAVTMGDKNAVLALIDGGADPDLEADDVTPLMVAAREGYEELARLLIARGANPSKRCNSFSAADYARHGGHEELAAMLGASRL